VKSAVKVLLTQHAIGMITDADVQM